MGRLSTTIASTGNGTSVAATTNSSLSSVSFPRTGKRGVPQQVSLLLMCQLSVFFLLYECEPEHVETMPCWLLLSSLTQYIWFYLFPFSLSWFDCCSWFWGICSFHLVRCTFLSHSSLSLSVSSSLVRNAHGRRSFVHDGYLPRRHFLVRFRQLLSHSQY